MPRRLTLALLALLAAPAASTAQDGGRPAVLELPSGARALGLGLAFQTDESDSDAIFVSPALASRAEGFSMALHLLSKQARAYTLSAATDWFDGGIAVGLRALEYGTHRGMDEGPHGLDPLRDGGPTAVGELAASLTYGRELLGLRVGVTGSLVDRRVGSARRQDVVADLGVARSLGPGWAHLTVRHLGDDEEIDLPTDVTLGWGAWGRPLGPLDVGGAAAVTRRDDGEWIVGGGLELGYWPVIGRTFIGRVGVRTVPEGEAWPVTFGGSYQGDTIVLDYAFQGFEGRRGSHQIALAWR